MNRYNTLRNLSTAALTLILAGCGTPSAPKPTEDVGIVPISRVLEKPEAFVGTHLILQGVSVRCGSRRVTYKYGDSDFTHYGDIISGPAVGAEPKYEGYGYRVREKIAWEIMDTEQGLNGPTIVTQESEGNFPELASQPCDGRTEDDKTVSGVITGFNAARKAVMQLDPPPRK